MAYAYVAAYLENALAIIDISDPANPSFKGVIKGSGVEPWLNNAISVYVPEAAAGVAGLNPALMEILGY